MNILLTGGAGYIGSHTYVELVKEGHTVVIVDNFVNSSPLVLDRLANITGKQVLFYQVDVCDANALNEVFEKHSFAAVIHFAGLKAVGESVEKPLLYYRTNLDSTLTLLEVMQKHDVKSIVFSSSATVYGKPKSVPITEDFELQTANPYGQTKLMIEYILRDVVDSRDDFNVALLRYFNPVGAHESGSIGEDPQGRPNNLVPFIAQVASGVREKLSVFGDDYETPDGTGVRDYIHVVDLAKGHSSALKRLVSLNGGIIIYNLGTSKGTSVLEMIETFEKVSGVKIPFAVTPRRKGDIAECFADATKAKEELGWVAEKTVEKMCEDTWRWQSQNPNGFE